MIPEGVTDEIKSRLRLSELIGKTVKLKRRGKDYIGLSPFSNEKTPSFHVHDDRGFYKCFSTQKGGDCFTWMMETQKLTFREAVTELAKLTGVELAPVSDEERLKNIDRTRALAAHEWFQRQFMAALHSAQGEKAKAYILGRGYTLADCERFGIGYAPAGNRLLAEADAKGWSLPEMVRWGLAGEGERNSYSFFRDRLTFPIHDGSGRVVGFSARGLTPDAKPKYLNSRESPIFHKGSALFGMVGARKLLNKGADLFAVEGNLDAYALQLCELAGVAPLGTALTEDQLLAMWRLVVRPVLCFDGDRAGKAAAVRVARMALPLLTAGRVLRFVDLPPGEDPASILEKRGARGLKDALEVMVSHFEIIWRDCAADLDLMDPGDRGTFRKNVRETLASIRDEDTRQEWRRTFNLRFMAEVKPPAPAAEKPREWPDKVSRERKGEDGQLREPELTAGILLRYVWAHPKRREDHHETLASLPCGRFAPFRDWMLREDEDGMANSVMSLEEEALLGQLPLARAAAYAPEAWERAARAHIARWGSAPPD
jgi:DNA primase